MFLTIKKATKKLEDNGYVVILDEEFEQIEKQNANYKEVFRNSKKITKKYNDLLKEVATLFSIKEMRERLSANGITEFPKTKAELIDLFVTTFSE